MMKDKKTFYKEQNMETLAIIVPCYNEQEALPLFYKEASKVLEKLKESPDAAWTPAQTASQMELEDAEKKAFAQIYEKARYAETSCTKEEMEQMLRIR